MHLMSRNSGRGASQCSSGDEVFQLEQTDQLMQEMPKMERWRDYDIKTSED
jgi:hypothetical protein